METVQNFVTAAVFVIGLCWVFGAIRDRPRQAVGFILVIAACAASYCFLLGVGNLRDSTEANDGVGAVLALGGTGLVLAVGVVAWWLFVRQRPAAEPGAAPNGGPVTRVANSGGAEGPPSVS